MYVPLTGLRHAVRLVDGLTELDDPEGFARLALPGLARLVGCDSLSFTVLGAEAGQVSVTRYPDDISSHGSVAAFAAYVHEHPLANYHRETGDARPVMISDFLSRQGFHRLNLYGSTSAGSRWSTRSRSGSRPRVPRSSASRSTVPKVTSRRMSELS